jgi:hypothetical protein
VKKTTTIFLISTISTIFFFLNAAFSTPAGTIEFNGGSVADRRKVEQALHDGIDMVDNALNILASGMENFTEAEKEAYLTIFDPGNTGDIDEDFVAATYENLLRIQKRLAGGLQVEFADSRTYCQMMTLYYTDFLKVYVCPYFTGENNPERMARDLVHEVAHITFLARDRAYYSDTDSRYLALTPHGSAPQGLPLLSYFMREMAIDDTLYHPDAYSHLAADLPGVNARQSAVQELSVVPQLDSDVLEIASQMDQKLLNAAAPMRVNAP